MGGLLGTEQCVQECLADVRDDAGDLLRGHVYVVQNLSGSGSTLTAPLEANSVGWIGGRNGSRTVSQR
ncbi:hypothetical protein KB1_13240 [Cutibacterium modestum]|uniref:Uncharacterized protein n=1 Tax=Cutibacterium modestum TaxID=2559073 RepID=A0AAD1KQI7_9ACTN|nr:hypothetical protein KB1_13240 [Cutibacterium modestum]